MGQGGEDSRIRGFQRRMGEGQGEEGEVKGWRLEARSQRAKGKSQSRRAGVEGFRTRQVECDGKASRKGGEKRSKQPERGLAETPGEAISPLMSCGGRSHTTRRWRVRIPQSQRQGPKLARVLKV